MQITITMPKQQIEDHGISLLSTNRAQQKIQLYPTGYLCYRKGERGINVLCQATK